MNKQKPLCIGDLLKYTETDKYSLEYLKSLPKKSLIKILLKHPLINEQCINMVYPHETSSMLIELVDMYCNNNFYHYIDYCCGTTHIGQKLNDGNLDDNDLVGGFLTENKHMREDIIRIRDTFLILDVDKFWFFYLECSKRLCNCKYGTYGDFESFDCHQLRSYCRAMEIWQGKNKKDFLEQLYKKLNKGKNIKRAK